MNKETYNNSTLSHELVMHDERNISLFFAAIVTQLYVTEIMAKNQPATPLFIKEHSNALLSKSQRMFIHTLINHKAFESISRKIALLMMKTKTNQNPTKTILNQAKNPNFLIRQIFLQSEQIIEKYKFMLKYKDVAIEDIKPYELVAHLEDLSFTEQIICLSCIFSYIEDEKPGNKRLIDTLRANLDRAINLAQDTGRRKNKSYLLKLRRTL